MGLTEREAADMRREDAVSKAYRTFSHHEQKNRHQPALGFLSGLRTAVRDELVNVIIERVVAFIKSCQAGVRGATLVTANREGHNLIQSTTMSVGRAFDLAVFDRLKKDRARRRSPSGSHVEVISSDAVDSSHGIGKTDRVQARHHPYAGSSPAEERRMTRVELLDRLSKLLPSQFEQVLYRAEIPPEHLPGANAPLATRAVEVMRYVEQQNQLDELARIVQQVVTGGRQAGPDPR
jgi:hypothetical protein